MNHESLRQQTIDTPLFTLNGQTHWAKCVKCYDADTIHIVIELNHVFVRFRCRLQGIDTAEIRSANPDEKTHARTARDWLSGMILDKLIIVRCGEFDKYGRLLGTVFLPLSNEHNKHLGGRPPEQKQITNNDTPHFDEKNYHHINRLLVDFGYAYVYDGGCRKPFGAWFTTKTPT
jgi:endonuclease YncB( thermonuclease family)